MSNKTSANVVAKLTPECDCGSRSAGRVGAHKYQGTNLRELDEIEQHTQGLPFDLKMHCKCHKRVVVGRSPRISGKVKAPRILLLITVSNDRCARSWGSQTHL